MGRVPEVVSKITGTGKNIRQVMEHIRYIARNGKIEVEDEKGNLSFGQDSLKEIIKTWEKGKVGIPKRGKRRRESFNIVLSMPAGTDREGVKRAARKFAQERFSNHQYVFASHDDEAHAHVHLVVKAVDRLNIRMNPRKSDLQIWREHFAAKLREEGIMANATPRRARGIVQRSEKQSIFHIEQRGDVSTAKSFRKKAVVEEIKTGVPFQNPYSAPLLKARVETVKAYKVIAKALSSSADQNDRKLALDIESFLEQMPAVKTIHQQAVEAFYQNHKEYAPSDTQILRKAANSSSLQSPQKTHYKDVNRDHLKMKLSPRVEEIAEKYLGAPKSRKGKTWRYGSNQGSLSVTVKGQHQGSWYDFQTGEGGDIINLIEYSRKMTSYPELLEEIDRFLQGGIVSCSQPAPNYSKKVAEMKAEEEANLRSRIEDARRIHQESQPFKDTMAEAYLKKYRGIQLDLDPYTFYYHPSLEHKFTKKHYPALVIAIRDDQQAICGTHSIYLDPKTGRKISNEELITLSKGKEKPRNARTLSRGVVSIGQMIHKGAPNGQIALAEGVETGLSVAMAHPDWTVYATFSASNFEKVALHTKAKRIIICADNDGKDSDTAKSVKRAAENLLEKGIDVWIAEPERPKGINKWDFNDALIHLGVTKVRETLDSTKFFEKENSKELTDPLKNKGAGNSEYSIS